jgi:hypothetical protein
MHKHTHRTPLQSSNTQNDDFVRFLSFRKSQRFTSSTPGLFVGWFDGNTRRSSGVDELLVQSVVGMVVEIRVSFEEILKFWG